MSSFQINYTALSFVRKENAIYFSFKVFSMKVLMGDTICMCHPSHAKVELLATQREYSLFLSYFKTLSIGVAPGIKPAIFRSAVKYSSN